MGGKLHLKLNIATRPIANKYREGKMKSTLKRELKARETVERETRSASNARLWFSRLVLSSCRCVDPNGLPAVTAVGELWCTPRACASASVLDGRQGTWER